MAKRIHAVETSVAAGPTTAKNGIAMLFDPNSAMPRELAQIDRATVHKGFQRSRLAQVFVRDFERFQSTQLRRAGRQAAIQVVLPAQAYRRDHGDFPPTLELLIPDYLDSVPLDPCDPAGGPLRYRRADGETTVVWSVGDDGINNGGIVVDPLQVIAADVVFELK